MTNPNLNEKLRQDGRLADYCRDHPSYAGVRLSMLLFGDKWDREQARKAILREVPNLLRDYSHERGPAGEPHIRTVPGICKQWKVKP